MLSVEFGEQPARVADRSEVRTPVRPPPGLKLTGSWSRAPARSVSGRRQRLVAPEPGGPRRVDPRPFWRAPGRVCPRWAAGRPEHGVLAAENTRLHWAPGGEITNYASSTRKSSFATHLAGHRSRGRQPHPQIGGGMSFGTDVPLMMERAISTRPARRPSPRPSLGAITDSIRSVKRRP